MHSSGIGGDDGRGVGGAGVMNVVREKNERFMTAGFIEPHRSAKATLRTNDIENTHTVARTRGSGYGTRRTKVSAGGAWCLCAGVFAKKS